MFYRSAHDHLYAAQVISLVFLNMISLALNMVTSTQAGRHLGTCTCLMLSALNIHAGD